VGRNELPELFGTGTDEPESRTPFTYTRKVPSANGVEIEVVA